MKTITTHAIEQCEDRYGFRPHAWDADLAVLDIIEGRSRFLAGQPNQREQHRVRLGHIDVLAIYEPGTACIVTVLPPECMQ